MSAEHLTFYVAPDGNDAWSGQKAVPDADGRDGPFATLERAQAAVRAGGRTVFIRGGTYARTQPLRLGPADSGTEATPVIWTGYPGETVVLTGSRAIARWHRVTDPEAVRRLAPGGRDAIVAIDLADEGIAVPDAIAQRGSPDLELFWNGRRLTRSRWPRMGWLTVTEVPQSGPKRLHEGLDREKRFDGVPVGRHYGRIGYDGARPGQWADAREIYAHGYWTWDWSDSYQKVAAIDGEKREITFAEPHHHYGYTKHQRFYFLNILEEVAEPGTWCLDRARGTVYLWPPEPMRPGMLSISVLTEPLIHLQDCAFVRIERLTLAFSRGSGLAMRGGRGNLAIGCHLHHLGGDAMTLDDGTGNGVQSCDIFDVSLQGIRLHGGDRKTLTPAGHFAVNNHIFRFSQWVRTYQLALNVRGVGNRAAHNLIHDAPHEAIHLGGNDHVIEFNEVHHVVQETGDAGALHTGRDLTWRGNVIRHNYFHHLKGPGLHGVVAIYLDDFSCGFTVYGNVCYLAGRGTLIGGGRDNVVENNIYVGCNPSVHLDARGLSWASYYYDGTYDVLRELLAEVNGLQPPYSTRYPELLRYYDESPATPKNNRFVRNVSCGGRFMDLYDYFAYDISLVTVKDNVIADPILCRRLAHPPEVWDPYYLDIDREEGYVMVPRSEADRTAEFRDNLIVDKDPAFCDLEGGDFRLPADSPAFALGFAQIPMGEIGLYTDAYRRTIE